MKMLARKVGSSYKKRVCQYLSTLPSVKAENIKPAELNSENIEDKEKKMLQHPDYFNVHNLFTIKDLFNARVHYGHKISSLDDKMKPFIFGARLGHIIFDLDITGFHLREALNFAAHMAYRDAVILFVSRNPRMTLMVEQTAFDCKEFAVTREWKMGVFTDSTKVFKNIVRLPELLIMLNTTEESGSQHQAVVEAAKMCIPTIAIVDSNCDPNLITYPVPGNDDSYTSFSLYCKLFKEAILRGKEERRKNYPEIVKQKIENLENLTQAAKNLVGNQTANVENVVQSDRNVMK